VRPAWEALGPDDRWLDAAARDRLASGDQAGALALARLAKDPTLEAWALHQLGDARCLALVRRGNVAAETAATIAIARGEVARVRELLHGLGRSDRTNWANAGGNERRTLGWAGLALLHHTEGEHTRALAALREAFAVTPGHTGGRLVEIASLAALGFADRARAALRTLEKHHPLVDTAWGQLRRSALEEQLGAVDRRRRALETAEAAFARGDHAAAAASYQRALRASRGLSSEPARAGALRWAVALGHLGRRPEATAVARRLLAADADNQSALRVLAWAATGATAARAYAAGGLAPQLDAGLHPKHRTLAGFRLLPAGDALAITRHTCRARAERLVHHGMYAEAITVWSALRLEPGEPARFLAAYAANQLGRRALAWRFLAPYLEAHREDSYYAQPIDPWLLAEQVAPTAKARTAATAYIADTWKTSDMPAHVRDPELLARRALHARAFAAERDGDTATALALYLEALERDPDGDVAGNAANLLAQARDFGRADRYFALVRFLVGTLDPPLRRGWQLAKLASRYHEEAKLRRGNQARTLHARAATIAARSAELTRAPGDYHTLAACRAALGDVEGAHVALAAALALDPTHDDSRALRDELAARDGRR
jgi:tetratricopeptide (TPR) repeat protein